MASARLAGVAEYLSASYRPDREYIDGVILERNLGERDHSAVQTVEILSPEDRGAETQERIDDYLAFGVRYVWVVNPRARRAYIHSAEGSHEAKDGVLRTENPDIAVPLAEIFATL